VLRSFVLTACSTVALAQREMTKIVMLSVPVLVAFANSRPSAGIPNLIIDVLG
jgi:hypothetical protein